MKKTTITLLSLLLLVSFDLIAQSKSEAETKGLAIGTKAPSFALLNQDSMLVKSEVVLNSGPMLIIFYRGQWCPFCNKHLSAISDSLALLKEKGLTVVAISPEKPAYLRTMKGKTNAEFTFLFDENYQLAAAFDVLYDPDAALKARYNQRLNARLTEAHNDSRGLLPVPATFLINTNGEIIWRHFDHDYKSRSTVADIVEKLK